MQGRDTIQEKVCGPRSAARALTRLPLTRSLRHFVTSSPDCSFLAADCRPRTSSSAGFTLIEVLAALVIVSLGMMAVIQAVSQTASNSSYLRDKTIAHWVAMNRLTEVRLEQAAPKVDKSSDEVEMAGREWRWTMEVTQTPVETMRRIDISVRPAEADEGSSMASITGFYGSAIAPPGAALVLWEGLPKGARSRNPGEDDDEGDGDSDTEGDEPPKLDPPEDEEQPDMPDMPEDAVTPPEEDPTL